MSDRPPFPGRVAQIQHDLVNGGAPIMYAEFAGQPHSPDWNFDRDHGRVTRTIIVKTPNGFQDLINAKMLFLGGAVGTTGLNNRVVSRILPHSLPVSCTAAAGNGNTGGRYLWCTGFKAAHGQGFRGVDEQYDINNWSSHFVNLEYTQPDYKIIPDEDIVGEGDRPNITSEAVNWQRNWTVLPKPEIQYLTLPRGSMYRAEPVVADTANNRANRRVPFGVGKVVTRWALKATWHDVPERFVPSSTINPAFQVGLGPIETTLGCVNARTFNRYPPSTLLFLGFDAVGPYLNPIGVRSYDLHYTLSFLKNGHQTIAWPPSLDPDYINFVPNFTPIAGTPGWVQLQTRLDNGVYGLGDETEGVRLFDPKDFIPAFSSLS